MVTGSTRGKCSVPHAGQTRFQPPQASWLSIPQAAQKPCRRRQSNSDLAVPAMAASGPGSSAAASRISWKTPTPRSGPAVGSIEPSISTANTGACFHIPRNSSRSSATARACAIGSHASRGSPSASSSGRPSHSTSASASGFAPCSASHSGSFRRSPARSSGLPAKVFRAGRGMAPLLARRRLHPRAGIVISRLGDRGRRLRQPGQGRKAAATTNSPSGRGLHPPPSDSRRRL